VKGGHVKVIFKRWDPGAKKGMLRRTATRTRARPRTRSTPNTSTHAYRHNLRPAPTAPHPHATQGFFINSFFIVARSLNVRSPLLVRQAQLQWRSTCEGRA